MLNWSFLPNFHEKIQVELGLSICHIFFLSKGKLCKYCISGMSDVKEKSRVILHNVFFFSKFFLKNPSLRKRFQYFVCVLNNGVNESFKTQQFFFRIFQLGHPIHSECASNSTRQSRTIFTKKSHGKSQGYDQY